VFLVLALAVSEAGGVSSVPTQAQSATSLDTAEEKPIVVIQSYRNGLSHVHSANPQVQLTVGRDPVMRDEAVLLVDYPAPTGDPAGRDVRCDAETQDWSGGRALSFRIKPSHALRLSVSFFDRNRVVYTAWTELKGDMWQPVRIAFDDIRPNPFFQPPDARRDAPIDVSDVKFIAFAPQDRTSGRLAISQFVVVK
jgi:carbohydrate binding protein with CBM11 domain